MEVFINNHWIKIEKIKSIKHGKLVYTYINNDIRINSHTKIRMTCVDCDKTFDIKYINYKKSSINLCKTCKAKRTKLEKYGNYNNIEKIKQTNLKRYGVENISQVKNIRNIINKKNQLKAKEALEKRKQTNLERYGVEFNFQDNNTKEKIKKTLKKNYGFEYISQSPYFKEKFKKTNFKRYGVDHPFKLKNIQEKRKQTNLEKYGVEHVLQSESIRKKIKENKIKNIFMNMPVTPLFNIKEYITKDSKYQKFSWKCKTCNTIFKTYYANGIIPKCPECFPNISNYSKLEKEIVNFIKDLDIYVIENTRKIIPPYELDIYLPNYNLAIEFNGIYWHSIKFIDDKWYHQKKVELCYRKDIRLLYIWENDWIENKENCIKMLFFLLKNKDIYIKVKKPILYNIENHLIWI